MKESLYEMSILESYDEALKILEAERIKLRQKSKRTKKEIKFLDEIDKRLNERRSLEGKRLLKELTKAIKNYRK